MEQNMPMHLLFQRDHLKDLGVPYILELFWLWSEFFEHGKATNVAGSRIRT